MVGPRALMFLDTREDLDAIGWDGDGPEKLWRYNQHYFDDLNAINSGDRTNWHRDLIADWIASNPPGVGTGWEPYPVSLRIVNWVKWGLAGNDLSADARQSLATQTRWLTRRLEIHLLGNHLFANAKALIFAGIYLDGPEADRWRKIGFGILARQVPEQILADGGHFERTTMYHALALEDLCDLINVARTGAGALTPRQRRQAADWAERVPAMVRWLRAMSHPDGDIALFNDAASGIAPTFDQLSSYVQRLDLNIGPPSNGPAWLAESGYARLETPQAVAFVDLAPVGPDYLPGHAHADTLSIELSVYGKRLLVNSGTGRYGAGAERLRQRGTAAHNTVVIAGEDSSEVWGGFRVARRARILERAVDLGGGVQVAGGSHDGYRRLPGRPVHERRVTLDDAQCVITDCVSDRSVPAIARFHFHPDVAVVATGEASGVATLADGRAVAWSVDGGKMWIESATWHPRFGHVVANVCLCVRLREGRSVVAWNWA